MNKITDDIIYAGVKNSRAGLFEAQYPVPNGMTYNSYVILDEKIAVTDTVDKQFSEEWLSKVEKILCGRKPFYLIIHHMEPDHSANIVNFLNKYPETKLVSSSAAFNMMKQFFNTDFSGNSIIVKEGDSLFLGKHSLKFLSAPMVHWPEVIVSYDEKDKVLFSADAFGTFGANDIDSIAWEEEARRYYIGIVGKYGVQVQNLLKKTANFDVKMICPLHGPVLKENLNYYLDFYNKWSSYIPESEGVFINYSSVYGHTEEAVIFLEEKLKEAGHIDVKKMDLSSCDISEAVAQSFKYKNLIFASITYNADVFPVTDHLISALKERNFCNRTVGFIENGSWAPCAAKLMKEKLSSCKNLIFKEPAVKIKSAMNSEAKIQLEQLALSFKPV